MKRLRDEADAADPETARMARLVAEAAPLAESPARMARVRGGPGAVEAKDPASATQVVHDAVRALRRNNARERATMLRRYSQKKTPDGAPAEEALALAVEPPSPRQPRAEAAALARHYLAR